VFNFDTFQNSKINQNFEFPMHLDLKPYSYYDVMEKEQRLPKEESETKEEDLPTEEEQKDAAPEEEDQDNL
jgi:ubiquitin carboxyl-terminal hydrolase 34